MNTTTFADGLNALFAARLHKGLNARSISESGDTGKLLIAGESMNAMQDFHQAIRDDEVSGYLSTWIGGDLFVYVQGLGWSKPIASAVVRAGSLFLISGSPGAGARQAQREASRPSCSAWFEELIGAPAPIALDLERFDENLWGNPEARGKEILGFPHRLRINGLTNYTLAAFDGYGCNSYALYFTRVSSETSMFLRLAWGGVYMKPEDDRPSLLRCLKEANRLFETALAKKLPMVLRHNMGEWYVGRDEEQELEFC